MMRKNTAAGRCSSYFICLLLAGCTLPGRALAVEVDSAATARFLLSHEKPSGAFGPLGQAHTDLAWNYPAVHALLLLGQAIPRPEDAFANGQSAAYLEEGSHQKIWSWDIYQRAQLARVLERNAPSEYDLAGTWKVEYADREGWYYPKIDSGKLKNRIAPFNDVSDLWHFVAAITGYRGKVDNPEAAKAYLSARQCRSGGFENAYDAELPRDESAAHIITTSEAVFIMRALELEIPNREACVDWIRSCQTAEGGFRWSPSNEAYSNKPDVWYTCYAVRALKGLSSEPSDPEGCLAWINSLQNADGGFGDRPGWTSRLYSTYCAIRTLDALTGNPAEAIQAKEITREPATIPEGKYSIFQSHLKSPTGGTDMVEAAHALKFNLLGVKTNTPDGPPDTLEDARRYAEEKEYPLELVGNPENYGHKLAWLGRRPAHHVSNWLLPPAMTGDQRRSFEAAHIAGMKGLPWSRYKTEVIAPVLEIGTLFYPEMDYTMMNAYMVYDDGLDGRPGYNAVIGALGWPPWDWIRMFPYRERWIGQLPIVADGDAHGDIEKWGERLDRQRILYLAENHGLAAFLDACGDGRTVCAIRRGGDRSELILYGAPAAVAYVRQHVEEWKWWD